MGMKWTTSVREKITESDFGSRLARTAGTLAGLGAGMVLFTLLTAGNANADDGSAEQGVGHGGVLAGLLRPVTESVGNVVGTTVDTAVVPVTREVARVVEPVTNAVAPVTNVFAPVIEPVTNAVAPVLEPVVQEVSGLAEPSVRPVVEPVVRVVVPAEERSIDPAPRVEPVEPVVTAAVHAVSAVAVVSAPVVVEHLPVSHPVRVVAARVAPAQAVGEWRTRTVPFSPFSPFTPLAPPTDPALVGTSSGVAAAPHGPGIDGPVFAGGAVLQRPAGSWRAPPGALTGPSWWTSYARQHPS